MTLFFVGAGIVTGSLHAAMRAAGAAKLGARASDLAVTKLSEMQAGLQTVADAGPTPCADEGGLAQWTWQIVAAPVDATAVLQGPGLTRVEIIIRNPSQDFTYRLTQILPEAGEDAGVTMAPDGVFP